VTFTTDIKYEDHQDFMRVVPPRPGQNAALLISHLFLIVVSVALLYTLGLFAHSLADIWRQDRLDVLLDNTQLMLLVAAGLLLLPIAALFMRSAIRAVIQAPALARTDSIDKSLLRDGLNTGPARFEVLSDGLRITLPLEEEQFVWSAFQGIRESDNILALMLDDSSGVIVPKRAFGDDAAFRRFKSLAEREIGAA